MVGLVDCVLTLYYAGPMNRRNLAFHWCLCRKGPRPRTCLFGLVASSDTNVHLDDSVELALWSGRQKSRAGYVGSCLGNRRREYRHTSARSSGWGYGGRHYVDWGKRGSFEGAWSDAHG